MSFIVGVVLVGLIVLVLMLSKSSSNELKDSNVKKIYNEIEKKQQKQKIQTEQLERLLENDTVLKEIDEKSDAIQEKARKELIKDRKTISLLKSQGIDIDDSDFDFNKKEILSELNKLLVDVYSSEYSQSTPDEILDFVNERIKFSKKISKHNYNEVIEILDKWEEFLHSDYEDWDEFDLFPSDEVELINEKEQKQKRKLNFETIDMKFRTKIFNVLSENILD